MSKDIRPHQPSSLLQICHLEKNNEIRKNEYQSLETDPLWKNKTTQVIDTFVR